MSMKKTPVHAGSHRGARVQFAARGVPQTRCAIRTRPRFFLHAMGSSGQAAVTDAMYFLIIASALCVFLFSFSNGYGNSAAGQMAGQYYADYATSALKTMLYSSTSRSPEQSIYTSGAEIDYLLAYVKEDYADRHSMGKDSAAALASSLRSVMRPLSNSFDYVFYISKGKRSDFVFAFMHMSNPDVKTSGRDLQVSAGSPAHRDYFCALGKTNSRFFDALQKLKGRLSSSYQASSKIGLSVIESGELSAESAEATLIIWTATDLRGVFDKQSAEWCCMEANEFLALPEEEILKLECVPETKTDAKT